MIDFGPGTFLLGFSAGALSTLSPCVLPLLPIVIATAVAQHRFGPLALAAGLTFSFTIAGTFIATLGASLGVDQATLRTAAAVLLVLFGVALLVPSIQLRLASSLAGSLSGAGDGLLARMRGVGWPGQFAVGIGLGLAWSPCVGPTLGAATTLASQGRQLGQIALLMLVFGLGASTPLLLIGMLSREAVARTRSALARFGKRSNRLFGAVLIAMGLLILTGRDKPLETWLLDHSPDWLTELTTRY